MEFDRRTFVKGAAATAAFLPSFSILRAEDKNITIGPKDDTINVAMIGFGAEGKVLAASLVRIPGVRKDSHPARHRASPVTSSWSTQMKCSV